MISIQVNPADLKAVTENLDNKVLSMKEITSPQSMTNISKAAFTIVGKDFLRSISEHAKIGEGRKRLQHMYEWNKSGINTARLFTLNRTYAQYGNLVITTKFLKSKTKVPIDPRLQRAGKTGKIVSSRSIFRDKAQVMESGQPIIIHTKKTVVFATDDGQIKFVPKGNKIYIRHPGGIESKDGYRLYSEVWFRKNFAKSMENSRIFANIEKGTLKVLNSKNSSPKMVREVVASVSQKYSRGLVVL